MIFALRLVSLFSLFCLLFGIDRITKWWALQYLANKTISITSFLNFELVINKGISWGMLYYNAGFAYYLVTVVIACVTVGLLISAYRRYGQQPIWPEVMVLAGAISNIIDRLYYQGVIDFISLSYGRWSFPVFNIADCCVVVGVCFMAYYYHVRPYE